MRLVLFLIIFMISCSRGKGGVEYRVIDPKILDLKIDNVIKIPKVTWIDGDETIMTDGVYSINEESISLVDDFVIDSIIYNPNNEEIINEKILTAYDKFSVKDYNSINFRINISNPFAVSCESPVISILCISQKNNEQEVKLNYSLEDIFRLEAPITEIPIIVKTDSKNKKEFNIPLKIDNNLIFKTIISSQGNIIIYNQGSNVYIYKENGTKELFLWDMEEFSLEKIGNFILEESSFIMENLDYLLLKDTDRNLIVFDKKEKEYKRVVKLSNDFFVDILNNNIFIADSDESFLYSNDDKTVVNFIDHEGLSLDNIRGYDLSNDIVHTDNEIFKIKEGQLNLIYETGLSSFLNIRRVEGLYYKINSDKIWGSLYKIDGEDLIGYNVFNSSTLSDKPDVLYSDEDFSIIQGVNETGYFKNYFFKESITSLSETCYFCDDDSKNFVKNTNKIYYISNISKDREGNNVDKIFEYNLDTNNLRQLFNIRGGLLPDSIEKFLIVKNELWILSLGKLYLYSLKEKYLLKVSDEDNEIIDIIYNNDNLFVLHKNEDMKRVSILQKNLL